MSRFFEEKIDPVNEKSYRPLLLDPLWWRVRFQRSSARYIGNPTNVASALTADSRRRPESANHMSSMSSFQSCSTDLDGGPSQDIDIPALQELIFQSNPTLEPISKWPHAPSMRFLPRVPKVKAQYAGQETTARGYINDRHARSSAAAHDNSRLEAWPELARDRFDNLHSLWLIEESSSARRSCFAGAGGGGSRVLPPMPLTAR
mmetsp:Transcript_10632/g.33300  ORF Transcript_10632/g.33300 Transcript_10632/m.33300 type:complete len:204 (-) Transcript_10632:30-641(-)